MASQNQIEANRRNAARSTGPQSAAGKRIVSKNAVRHGLLSIEGLLFGENEAEFALSRIRLESELAPVTEIEQIMANEIVWLAWKLNRARRMETALQRWKCHEALAQPSANHQPEPKPRATSPMADLYQRRKSQESLSQFSAYHQHRSNIINAASEMEAESTRTEPEKPDDMWQQTDLADLQFLDGLSASAWADSVELIERYESKTQRSLFRLLKELRALQAARRSSEATTQPSPVLPQAPSASGPGSPDTGREVPLSSSETDLQKVADETCRAAAGLALTSPADAHSCTL